MSANLQYQNAFERIYEDYINPEGRILVVAHRGVWSNAPENSLTAIRNAISSGVDMIEIDVQKTRDGELVLIHDDTVDRMTNGRGEIGNLTFDEIRSLRLKQSQGGDSAELTEECIPTLKEVMELVKDKVFVNLDKCWEFRDEAYQVVLETGTVKQALFKSTADLDEVEVFLNAHSVKPEYMHVIQHSNEHLLENPAAFFDRIRPKAVEFIFEHEYGPITKQETFDFLKGKCRVWVNSMWDSICAGHSDERSFVDASDGWGWGIRRGANMIQTDYAPELMDYLKTIA